jgi:hypothetical protein
MVDPLSYHCLGKAATADSPEVKSNDKNTIILRMLNMMTKAWWTSQMHAHSIKGVGRIRREVKTSSSPLSVQ